MTDENPRAGMSRPTSGVPDAPQADVDGRAAWPAAPGAADDPGPTDSSLTSVFPWRRRRTTASTGSRHAAGSDGDDWSDSSVTREMSLGSDAGDDEYADEE